MKICYLANAASIHTKRWALAMAGKGCSVEIISFDNANIDGVCVHYINPVKREANRLPSDPKTISYIVKYREVKKILNKIDPDIIHAHYATGYGMTGALCNYHPYIISTWGTDIFEAPRRNMIFKKIVEHNLRKADYITATSSALTTETMLYTDKKVHTIPFGIDTVRFNRHNKTDNGILTIGIVKSLEEVYGINYLLQAFKKIFEKYKNIRLLIVGGGSLHDELKRQCVELNIEDNVVFTGKISNDEVPEYLNMMDIFVMPSIRESFGVAALEASACQVPFVASDVGGIPEVVMNGQTGFLVGPGDVDAIADRVEALIKDNALRDTMGRNGRKFVIDNYNWNTNVEDMYNLYLDIVTSCRGKR